MSAAEKLYEKLKNVRVGSPLCSWTLERCRHLLPLIEEIQELKKEKDAIVLAHSYLSGDILYSVADFVGDSYGLAVKAKNASQKVIVFAAVDFMAETAKIINPEKTVLKPNTNGGCSLADSISGEDVRQLRKENPGFTFVCYINTTAEVKAECDVVVTSSNVYKIIETIPNENIFFVPDRLMAQNIDLYLRKKKVQKNLKWSEGTCYVHEDYDGSSIPMLRKQFPNLKVLAHPECKPQVASQADFIGSTSQMFDEIVHSENKNYFLLTECGLISRLEAEYPQKKFVGSCVLCKYMKGNSLEDIQRVLKNPRPNDFVEIPTDIMVRAKKSLDQMFFYSNKS